jgi:hypothetical protein
MRRGALYGTSRTVAGNNDLVFLTNFETLSHHHFRHPTKPGTVTVPHPDKDLTIGTLKSIERQSGLKFPGR